MFGFEFISVWIAHEGGVVVRAVIRPEARGTFVCTAELQRGGVEAIHGLAALGAKSQVKSWSGCFYRIRLKDEQQSVNFRPGQSVSDGVRAGKDPVIAKCCHGGIVKCGCPCKITDAK